MKSNSVNGSLPGWLPSRLSLKIGFGIFLLVIPVMGTSLWVFTLTQRDLAETKFSSAEVEAQQAITVLDRLVFERYGDAIVFSHLSQSRPFERASLEPLTEQLLTAYAPYYTLAVVTDSRGRIITASRMDGKGQAVTAQDVIGQSVKDEPWFQQTLAGSEPVQVEDYHDDALVNRTGRDHGPVMSFSAPIRAHNGNLLGVWSARMALTPLREALIGSQAPAATYAAPSLTLKTLSGNPILTIGPAVPGAPAATAVSSGFSRWPGMGWRVEVYSPKPEAEQGFPVWALWSVTGLLMLGGIVALGLVIQRRLLAPVSHLIAHAQAVIAQSQVLSVSPDSHSLMPPVFSLPGALLESQDELGELARTMATMEREVQNQIVRLTTLTVISRALVQEAVSLPALLTRILQAAQQLTGARYAALATFDEQGTAIKEFITLGIDDATRQRMGALPTGKGLLGALAKESDILRLKDLTQHPSSAGFCPHHPPMHSFLGTAIRVHDRVFGRIYLTEKRMGTAAAGLTNGKDAEAETGEFTELDEQLISVLTYQAGAAIEVAHLLDDVTATQNRYRAILDAVQNGIYGLDLSGRCLFINHAGAQMLGYGPDDLVGEVLHQLIHHTRKDGTAYELEDCPIMTALRTGLPCELEEDTLWRRDGTSFTVRYVVTPLRNAEQTLTGVVVTFADLTERILLESQLRQSQKMEAMGRLAGGIAHDFNNLLTIIKGYSELLLAKTNMRKDAWMKIEQIKKAADRATGLTNQLLSFSRNQELETKVVDVNEIVSSTASLLQRLLGEQIRCSVVLAFQPCFATLDAVGLEQILINLAVNARDAMPDGGELTIKTAITPHKPTLMDAPNQGGLITLTVTDTGVGMDAITQARIFEPFFTTKALGKGTGLGLATVYRVVERSGGSITVTSVVGAGTTFTITLPQSVPSGQPSPLVQTAVDECWGFETILLVEDDPAVRALTKTVLEGKGYTVFEAENGAAGLARAAAHSGEIQLLLTDGIMPEMNGWALARQLKQVRPGLRVLFLTGYADTTIPDCESFEELGDILQKPVSNEILARKVREVLERPLSETGSSLEASRQALRILVVDDDAQIRAMLEALLTAEQYEVRTCASGAEALKCLGDYPADLLLIDMLMPERDGLETVQQVRRAWPDIKAIAMSGGGSVEAGFYLSLATQFEVTHTLAKPFSKQELLSVIDRAVPQSPSRDVGSNSPDN
ncbi:MAG: response regulator [Nitrospirae bacterium]|nr:response regulator [Nitrospirota bacterium]